MCRSSTREPRGGGGAGRGARASFMTCSSCGRVPVPTGRAPATWQAPSTPTLPRPPSLYPPGAAATCSRFLRSCWRCAPPAPPCPRPTTPSSPPCSPPPSGSGQATCPPWCACCKPTWSAPAARSSAAGACRWAEGVRVQGVAGPRSLQQPRVGRPARRFSPPPAARCAPSPPSEAAGGAGRVPEAGGQPRPRPRGLPHPGHPGQPARLRGVHGAGKGGLPRAVHRRRGGLGGRA
jgi:hypothetical protein